MNLVTPDFGLLFWMVLIFGLFFFLLAKFGFPVITGMVEKRNEYIDQSLRMAKEAEERMNALAAEQEALIESARKQQNEILKEAALTKDKIIEQAKVAAQAEADKILQKAMVEIKAEKETAMRELRKQIAFISTEVAEKILRKHLENEDVNKEYISRLVDELPDFDKKHLGN